MDKIPIGYTIGFKLTVCPTINAPIIQGVLKKYCRVPGWQSVLTKNEIKTKHYPVKLAEVEVLTTKDVVRVDAKGIIDLTPNIVEV